MAVTHNNIFISQISFFFSVDLSTELERSKSLQKPLTVLFLGRVGKGKSTLINSLFGKPVVMESDSVHAEHHEVSVNTYNLSGIKIIMIDTPGFVPHAENSESMTATMQRIAEKTPGYTVDLIVYCMKMTDKLEGIDEWITDQLTRTYGEKFWSHSLFALTFANEVKPSRSCQNLDPVVHFKKQLGEMTDAIQDKMLHKSAGVSKDITDKVPVVPVGRPERLREGNPTDVLPDECNWLSNFWCQVLSHINEPVDLHPFIKANDHRFLDQTIKK